MRSRYNESRYNDSHARRLPDPQEVCGEETTTEREIGGEVQEIGDGIGYAAGLQPRALPAVPAFNCFPWFSFPLQQRVSGLLTVLDTQLTVFLLKQREWLLI